jgi:hypothetical protein
MKIKFVLIIVATLVIGFLLGFVTNGQITKSKIRTFVKTGTHEGFKGRYYHILRPDVQQKKMIDPILDKYGAVIHENVTTMQQRMKDIHQEMLKEIAPYLNEEQKKRLEESIRRFERHERMKHRPERGQRPDGQGKRRGGRNSGDCPEYF